MPKGCPGDLAIHLRYRLMSQKAKRSQEVTVSLGPPISSLTCGCFKHGRESGDVKTDWKVVVKLTFGRFPAAVVATSRDHWEKNVPFPAESQKIFPA
jgi:hypothetical protein